MIPLRDTTKSNTFPVINITLIAANIFIFFFQLSLGDRVNELIYHYGLVPATLFSKSGLSFSDRFFPFISSMFLHGGWMHIIGNMLFLHVFGDNVEDRMGHSRYLMFYIFCGFIAAFFQIATNLGSQVPMVGASGAISGVLAAYLLFFPKAKILTLVPIFIFIQFIHLPAIVYILFWFGIQLLSGIGALSIPGDGGGVAFWAHIGGFIGGLILAKSFQKKGYKLLSNIKTKYYH
ncbi:MAG: rhomboid family intramembrane serine protease [Candidatus Dadabacteria bacterium]|nr:rhomboid family intramembrane serine protease [Candidatus Dadabacteria bacterium]NIS09978.1 rhomboid family intramembrane serine protease [Candidatus Dadabacteria bacterium]NIY22953.1 rhomboid family intramembrane serine protease [Candidatus Dadabacteria bacterium]